MDTVAVREEYTRAARETANRYYREQLGGADRYAAGFAWITVTPKHKGNTRAGKAERKVLADLGFRKDWTGKSWEVWNPSQHPCQNVDTKSAGAQAGAEVLRRYGLDAHAGSRLD
jgi:hypothetical protein